MLRPSFLKKSKTLKEGCKIDFFRVHHTQGGGAEGEHRHLGGRHFGVSAALGATGAVGAGGATRKLRKRPNWGALFGEGKRVNQPLKHMGVFFSLRVSGSGREHWLVQPTPERLFKRDPGWWLVLERLELWSYPKPYRVKRRSTHPSKRMVGNHQAKHARDRPFFRVLVWGRFQSWKPALARCAILGCDF